MGLRTLRFESGVAAGQTVDLDRELVVGREGVDLTIADPELSRRHAVLRPVENGVEVEDLGSLNGTFVDGRRLTGPELLTASARIKMGTNEATLELALPQVTRLAETPIADPDVTAQRPIPSPEVTAQRPIADPEVTAQRPIPSPEVTAQRPVADPEVTAQRPVAEPDVTAQRPIAGPDVTVQRPVGAAGPPPGPAPPTPREEDDGGGGKRVPLIIGALALVAAIVIVIVLAAGGGESTEERRVVSSLEVRAASAADKRRSETRPGKEAVRWKLQGTIRGAPFGTGKVVAFVTLQPVGGPPPGTPEGAAPPPSGKPRPALVTSRFEMTFDNGTVTATERVESRMVGEGLDFEGTGRILDGTGEFEGAQGTLRISGSRPRFDRSLERVRWRGTVEY